MSQKSVLDYEPTPPAPTWRMRVGAIAAAATGALAAPCVFLALGELLVHPVQRDWISTYQFNEFLRVAWGCNIAGIIIAFVAIRYGRPNAGGLLFLLHVSSSLLLPVLAYA